MWGLLSCECSLIQNIRVLNEKEAPARPPDFCRVAVCCQSTVSHHFPVARFRRAGIPTRSCCSGSRAAGQTPQCSCCPKRAGGSTSVPVSRAVPSSTGHSSRCRARKSKKLSCEPDRERCALPLSNVFRAWLIGPSAAGHFSRFHSGFTITSSSARRGKTAAVLSTAVTPLTSPVQHALLAYAKFLPKSS